ncbi:unnamed protein product [Caenorhabditis brenneri]
MDQNYSDDRLPMWNKSNVPKVSYESSMNSKSKEECLKSEMNPWKFSQKNNPDHNKQFRDPENPIELNREELTNCVSKQETIHNFVSFSNKPRRPNFSRMYLQPSQRHLAGTDDKVKTPVLETPEDKKEEETTKEEKWIFLKDLLLKTGEGIRNLPGFLSETRNREVLVYNLVVFVFAFTALILSLLVLCSPVERNPKYYDASKDSINFNMNHEMLDGYAPKYNY